MIVDYNFYNGVYPDTVEEKDFNLLNNQAQPIIEMITHKSESVLLGLESDDLDRVKKAICSQIYFFADNGGTSVVNGDSSKLITSESYAGSYSWSKQSNDAFKSIKYVNGLPIAPMVNVFLAPTNLLYAGVDLANA